MESLARDILREEQSSPTMTIEITLYNLIEAIQGHAPAADDEQIIEALSRILRKGRIRFEGDIESRKVLIG